MTVNNEYFAVVAYGYRDSGIPYSKLDCQAFVEQVLSDCGMKRNWRGSNDMWRNALSWRGTAGECIRTFGKIPAGAWLFTVADDGGERARGYTDNDGNAKHVGIYTGYGRGVMHSTTGGVQECDYDTRWTHVGLAKDIDYNTKQSTETATIKSALESIIDQLLTIIAKLGD